MGTTNLHDSDAAIMVFLSHSPFQNGRGMERTLTGGASPSSHSPSKRGRRTEHIVRLQPGGSYAGQRKTRYRHPTDPRYGGSKYRAKARRLRPGRRRRMARSAVTSRSLSAASLRSITDSAKTCIAAHDVSLPTIDRTTEGSERSSPMAARNMERSSAHAEQLSSVCWASSSGQSSQWWHRAVGSRPAIRHRYPPKQPCPESICVRRNDRTPCCLANHCSRTGRTAPMVLLPALGSSSLPTHSNAVRCRNSSRSAVTSRGANRTS
ncbi:uncharacterized protein LOC135310062 [Plodia interpunctella]|uniref:uncharacterized protein LOC135310062 n=1 Tax=Plodia interpunctella TaxID=58824 RepID=UPI0031019E2F